MREYIFKGKRKDNNEWVYGFFAKNEYGTTYIIESIMLTEVATFKWAEVIPETVGQYIGTKDRNSNRIFEGDILKGEFATGSGGKSTKYKEMNFSVGYHDGSAAQFFINMPMYYGNYRFLPSLKESEIIGSIHDNPELLK